MNSYKVKHCEVKGCRFSYSHTTSAHLCGTCKTEGHGQYECGNPVPINQLSCLADKPLPDEHHCTMDWCLFRDSHTNRAHHCELCKGNHSATDCPKVLTSSVTKVDIKLDCPICRTENIIPSTQKKVYGISEECKVCLTNSIEMFLPTCGHTCICMECAHKLDKNVKQDDIDEEDDFGPGIKDKINAIFGDQPGKVYTHDYGGMGCLLYYKRDDVGQKLTSFFMHSDTWGQYGPDADCRPKLFRFLHGHREIKNEHKHNNVVNHLGGAVSSHFEP